jgi:hypothetical protein
MAKNESEFAVHLTDPKGKPFVLLPGKEIPSWAAKQITNPYVLGIDPDAEDDADDDDELDGPPPLEGKGSGVTAWRKYAADQNVDVEGLDRDQIVAKLQEEGVSVDRD